MVAGKMKEVSFSFLLAVTLLIIMAIKKFIFWHLHTKRVTVPMRGCMHTCISTSNNGNMLHLTVQMSKISLSLLLTPILTEVVPVCGDFPTSSQLDH